MSVGGPNGEAMSKRDLMRQTALLSLGLAAAPLPARSEDGDLASGEAKAPASVKDIELPFNDKGVKVGKLLGKKATLVVNIKIDDPMSQQQMPEITRLMKQRWRDGFSVIAVPTDQGYYEPDESFMVRTKTYSAFGFGQFPQGVVVDKMDIVGTNIHPFYRYICKALPNPNGLKRVSLNFEKFLLDADGKPVRRYTRKYPPTLIEGDIQALMDGQPLPPVSSEWKNMWLAAEGEAERSEYSFKKNTNYF